MQNDINEVSDEDEKSSTNMLVLIRSEPGDSSKLLELVPKNQLLSK